MKDTEKVTISAFSSDYSDKAFAFHFGKNQREFVPKSQVKFIENKNGGAEFGEGIASRWFSIPVWLVNRLQGINFYTVLY